MKEVSGKPGFLNFRCVKLPQLPLSRVTPTTELAAWKSRDGVQVNSTQCLPGKLLSVMDTQ